jgi:hypothetical protein
MVDNASQLCWTRDDANLLSYFNSTYPQTKPWQMRHVFQPVLSKLISLLSQPNWQPKSPENEPRLKTPTGIWIRFCEDMQINPGLFHI